MKHPEANQVVRARVHGGSTAMIEVVERNRALPLVVPLRDVRLEPCRDSHAHSRQAQRDEDVCAHVVGVVHRDVRAMMGR